MENAKQTYMPGPWEVAPLTEDGRYVVRAQTGARVASTNTNPANARLVAAAPDLLAALKSAENRIAAWQAPMTRAEQEECGSAEELRVIRAAIAKAEGGR